MDVNQARHDEPIGKFAGKSSLIYAGVIKDTSVEDYRLEGRNYIIFTIIHPSWLDAAFVGREELKQTFEQFIKKHPDVAEWTDNDLEFLGHETIKVLLQTSL
jgi:hypothetical protein